MVRFLIPTDGAKRFARFSRRIVCALAGALTGLVLPTAAASAEAPQRIVSVGGAVTEIVSRLGLGDRLVAVDSTSQYPAAMKSLPQVGYMRSLSAEGIVALRPDLILLSENAGPPPVIEQLRDLDIPLGIVPDRPSVDGVAQKIRAVGAAVGQEKPAEALARDTVENVAAVTRIVETVTRRPRVLFLMGIGRGAPMAAGRNTAADAMIRLAGGVNAIDGYEGYKPASSEAIVAAASDILLLPDEAMEAAGGRQALLTLPQIAGTRAARDGRVVTMDTLYLLGFGPRMPAAVADLARALHPDRASEFPAPELPVPEFPKKAGGPP